MSRPLRWPAELRIQRLSRGAARTDGNQYGRDVPRPFVGGATFRSAIGIDQALAEGPSSSGADEDKLKDYFNGSELDLTTLGSNVPLSLFDEIRSNAPKMGSLTKLSLKGISDTGVAALADAIKPPSGENKIGAVGMSDAIERSPVDVNGGLASLTTLVLSGNQITIVGMKSFAAAKRLASCSGRPRSTRRSATVA